MAVGAFYEPGIRTSLGVDARAVGTGVGEIQVLRSDASSPSGRGKRGRPIPGASSGRLSFRGANCLPREESENLVLPDRAADTAAELAEEVVISLGGGVLTNPPIGV